MDSKKVLGTIVTAAIIGAAVGASVVVVSKLLGFDSTVGGAVGGAVAASMSVFGKRGSHTNERDD